MSKMEGVNGLMASEAEVDDVQGSAEVILVASAQVQPSQKVDWVANHEVQLVGTISLNFVEEGCLRGEVKDELGIWCHSEVDEVLNVRLT